jgi:phage terminase small subunit
MPVRRRIKVKTKSKIPRIDNSELTDKETAFLYEYLKDYQGGAAAKRVGYAEKSASVSASLILQKPRVQKAIENYEKDLSTRFINTKERVLKEMALLAYSDLSDYVDVIDGKTYLKTMDQLPPQVSRAIKKIKGTRFIKVLKQKAKKDKEGKVIEPDCHEEEVEERIEIELYDKAQALQLMGKELNMFKDKTEITGANGTSLFPVKLVLDFGSDDDAA